jgi:hypothetical protein
MNDSKEKEEVDASIPIDALEEVSTAKVDS